uniref:GIY-YIG nuclease family protein n=1 Tax=Algoriphagus locisalis TaxID=305507 RepID=UPI000B897236|nr:GIY-YIG nuclease family protein [Algoriphagus locisalis]
MGTLYILFSDKLNKYYVGACSNLERRLYEHTIGHSKFTATGIPWRLVYKESFDDLTSAKRKESYVKRMKSRKYIEALISSAGRASRF